MTQLAIIVPILNEAENLPLLFSHLQNFYDKGVEIILVDGGSTDGSLAMLRASSFITISSECGRAKQMNAAAAISGSEVLLFLHADTRLPVEADKAIDKAMSTDKQWGRFDVQIHGDHPLLPMVAMMMNLRSRLSGIATGDQALFIRRDLFEKVGGFPPLPLMEDIALTTQLKRCTKPACLFERVVTSGRRWESKGLWRTIWLMWQIRFAYWRGVPAARLAKRYQ